MRSDTDSLKETILNYRRNIMTGGKSSDLCSVLNVEEGDHAKKEGDLHLHGFSFLGNNKINVFKALVIVGFLSMVYVYPYLKSPPNDYTWVIMGGLAGVIALGLGFWALVYYKKYQKMYRVGNSDGEVLRRYRHYARYMFGFSVVIFMLSILPQFYQGGNLGTISSNPSGTIGISAVCGVAAVAITCYLYYDRTGKIAPDRKQMKLLFMFIIGAMIPVLLQMGGWTAKDEDIEGTWFRNYRKYFIYFIIIGAISLVAIKTNDKFLKEGSYGALALSSMLTLLKYFQDQSYFNTHPTDKVFSYFCKSFLDVFLVHSLLQSLGVYKTIIV